MILLFKKAFFVISLSSLVTLAQADPSRKGTGSDGGGGCSVLHQSHWILKDFVRAKMENRLVDQLGQKLSMNTVGEKLGFEPLDGLYGATPIQQIGAYQYLQKKIKLWQEGMGRQPNSTGSRNLLDLISWGLQRVKYTVVPYVFQSIAFGCTNQNEIPILIYGADYESALISLPQWNQLDLQSQAGSLLKEVFRFLQTEKNSILFSGSNMSEENERRISKALSLIILSHPNEISSESDILFRSFVAKDDELMRYPHQMKDWRLIQEVMMKVERWCKIRSQYFDSRNLGESGYIICSFDSDSENYFSLIQKIQEKLSEDEALLKSRLASLNQLEAINKVLVVLDELRSLKRSTMSYNMKIIDEDPTTKMLVLGFNEMNQGVRQCLNNLNLCNADDVDAISNLVKKLRESIYYGKDEIWVNRNLIGLRTRFLETISPRGFFLSP